MKKFILLILILATVFVFAQTKLKVGILLGEPYAFWSVDRLTGIDYDVINEIAKILKTSIDLYVLPFSALDKDILSRLGLDIVLGGIHKTTEREKIFTFSTAYLKSGLAIVLRKDLKWDGEAEKIHFGVKKGATGEKIVQTWVAEGKKVRYTSFVSNSEVELFLILKKIDAGFFDYYNALYLKRLYGFEVHEKLIYETDVAMVIINTSFTKALNEAINLLLKAGKIDAILKKYQ